MFTEANQFENRNSTEINNKKDKFCGEIVGGKDGKCCKTELSVWYQDQTIFLCTL